MVDSQQHRFYMDPSLRSGLKKEAGICTTENQKSLRFVNRLAPYHCTQHLGLEYLLRLHLGDVAVEHDEIRQHTRRQRALFLLHKLGVGGAGGVSGDGLVNAELLLRLVGSGAGFVLARDRSIQSSEGSDGFNG